MRRLHVKLDLWVSEHAESAAGPRMLLTALQSVVSCYELFVYALVAIMNQS